MVATKRTFKPNILNKMVDLGNGMKVKVKISAKAYKRLRGLLAHHLVG